MAKPRQQEVTNEQLITDIKKLMGSLEDLVGAAANNADAKVAVMREKAEHLLEQVRSNVDEATTNLKIKTQEISQKTDEYVHENPWSSVGIAAGVGLLVGLLLSARK